MKDCKHCYHCENNYEYPFIRGAYISRDEIIDCLFDIYEDAINSETYSGIGKIDPRIIINHLEEHGLPPKDQSPRNDAGEVKGE